MATTATRSSLLLGLLLSLVLVQNIALVFSYDQFSYLPPSGHNSWALPNEFASFGDRLFFSARDRFRGAEPWVTDGTVNGTHIFADLNPGSFGSSPVGFTSLNGKLFFITLYQRTPTIWISDGTPAGTTAIPGTEGARERLVVNGDYLVFTRATTETGTELWSLNSLTLEVRPLGDFVPGVGSSSPTLKATNGTHSVWFLYDANFNFKPFITDGTPEGTFLVPDVPGSEDRWFLSNVWASGTDFVITRNSYDDRSEFYRTNGVSGTLVLSLESITIYSYEGSGVFLSPTQLLFVGRNTEGYGVYSTDFTPEGTIRIHYPGTDLSTAILNAVVGGRGLFTSGTTMYSTDGTVAGTTMVGVDISAPVLLGFIEGDAIFVSAGFSNTKLYRTDGIEVHLLWTGISYLYSGNGALGSRIFFGCSETDADGIELCSTDGTPAGTGIWEHIDTVDDGFPYRIVPVTPDGTTVAFLYNSSVWTANGLPDGTHKILDESPSGIVAGTGDLTGSVFFNGGSGFWRYDSSTGELTRIFDLPAVPLASANSRVFMYRVLSRYEAMLYSSDGTVNNTIELGYVPTSPQGFVEGDVFIFTSLYTTGGVRLMKSDGLTVSVLKDINPSGDASPRSWVPAPSVGGHVFIANSPAVGLWKTDGTTNGTVLLHDLSSFFPNPVMQNGYIYLQEVADLGIFILIPISSTGSDVEYALYLYDPETDSISSEAIHSWPRVQTIQTASTGDRLILIFRFTTATSTSTELWSSDGTTAGTIHITPPAQGHIFPSLTSAPNGRAYFVAWSPVEGEELWSTGGTQATTSLVPGPAYPGILGSVPRELTIIGNHLYFNAISTSFVRQIYVIPFGSVEPSSLPRISSSPGHVPSHSPSSHPSTAPSAAPSIPPPRVLLHIFGPSGWLSGEQTFEWGTGRCRVKNRMVPSAIPLTGTETPVHLTRGRALKVKTKDWAGCGGFYYHHNHDQFLDLRGAKEIRFWIRSNTLAKVEFEIGEHDSTPREPESDQNPLKDFIYVDTTGDKWVQVSLSVAHRTEEELQRVYSPFLITIFGRGYAMVSNVIAVA